MVSSQWPRSSGSTPWTWSAPWRVEPAPGGTLAWNQATWLRPNSARHLVRSASRSTALLSCLASVRGASDAGNTAIAASHAALALFSVSWLPGRSRSPRWSRPPSLRPLEQTAAPNLSRPLLSSSSRRRHRPPWCAPRQPPSPTQISPPLRRSSRLPLGPAAGRVATLGTLIFIFAAVQLPESPTVNSTTL